uniref:Uncharacterized protein n=1 Tax=candidate division CPR3 bacterium TaxID=2268181 RepID=A0A7V3JA92_UNCC3
MTDEEKQKKINQINKKFADILYSALISTCQKAFKVEKEVISASELKAVVKRYLPEVWVATQDERFQITDWSTWQNIINWDWTDHKEYIADFFDCDNYSSLFNARAAEIYLLNSAGRLSCSVETPQGLLPHRASIIVAKDGAALKVYILETQNDEWVEVEKGKPIKIKNWVYYPTQAEFN